MTPRDLKTVSVLTYTTGTDAYGDTLTTASSSRSVEMSIYIYSQREVQDPRYAEAEYVAFTKDYDITTSNVIQDGTKKYQILYIIPTRRWNSMLLKEME